MRRHILSVLCLGALLFFAAACGEEGPPPAEAPADSVAVDTAATESARVDTAIVYADTARVSVEDFEYIETPEGDRFFRGTFYNPTPEHIGQAEIFITLLGENNLPIGTGQIVVQDIAPGERQEFSEPVSAEEPFRRARIRSILVQ